MAHGFEIANWYVDPWRTVLPARFHQRNGMFAVLRKTIGKRATGRPGANDDKVKFQSAASEIPATQISGEDWLVQIFSFIDIYGIRALTS